MNIMGVLIFSIWIPTNVLCTILSTATAYNFHLIADHCISSLLSLCLYIYYDSLCLEVMAIILPFSFPIIYPLVLHLTLPGYLLCIW